jgi:tetraprenyl-beta-curcumene synthase
MPTVQTTAMSAPDPAPLSLDQLRTLATSAARELGWGLRAVSAEFTGWRTRALAIPDPSIRHLALEALGDKRPLLDGAALFWILPDRRQPELLRLLVAFQTLANFHDHASERAGRGGGAGPGSSMLAFLDVVDVDRPLASYGEGPKAADGGYLYRLAQTCRTGCATLPNYRKARELLLQQAHRARTLDLEHDPDPQRRAYRLKLLAGREFVGRTDAAWWELTAGASSLLTAIVLLGLAAEERTTEDDLSRAVDAYTWVASVSSLLDNYIDQFDDVACGDHNYFDYYPAPAAAVQRIGVLIDRALREVGALRNGERHLMIVASMTAMYLSSDSARSRRLRVSSRTLAAHGGALTRLLIPILRAWRIAYGQRGA